MPTMEKTLYNQKTMHVVFALSTLVMLVATVWLLAKDHYREWKRYQLDFRDVDRWTTAAQLHQTEVETAAKLEKAERRLRAARQQPVDSALTDAFLAQVKQENARLQEETGKDKNSVDLASIQACLGKLNQAAKQTGKDDVGKAIVSARDNLIKALDKVIAEAIRREDKLALAKKFAVAEHTALVSELGIAVNEAKPEELITKLQAKIDIRQAKIDLLNTDVAAAADYRTDLETIVQKQIRGEELVAKKEIDAILAELNRLREQLKDGVWERIGDRIVRAPILDAFNNTDIGIKQIWLSNLTIDYNFTDVARFDRCVTCHRGIDRTQPGMSDEPLYPTIPAEAREQTFSLMLPDEKPEISNLGKSVPDAPNSPNPEGILRDAYGLILAPRGQVHADDVTIQFVLPVSAAARAGLAMGDVLLKIGGKDVESVTAVSRLLVDQVAENAWGEPVNVTVRRGLDHPFTSHPRLDLYLGSLSPHPKETMGCTICHDGQGSGTEFRWASHMPNDSKQADAWYEDHAWFDNHHWIFPMSPKRFVESNCLKCHHEVVELEPSEHFPEPPAPKLVRGWKLIREYGCYGCHEINGYDGLTRRIGPDLRLEPNYFAVAQQVLRDGNLSSEERSWAETLVTKPEANAPRERLMASLLADARLTEDKKTENNVRLNETTHNLGKLLKGVSVTGKMRKVGPSLRFVKDKVAYDWLHAWIRKPSDFRPSTTMPQIFGHFKMYDYLDDRHTVLTIQGLADKPQVVSDVEYTRRMEAIETQAIADYLLAASDTLPDLPKAEGVTEGVSAERGRQRFQTRGCLACHSHEAFPEIHSTQGAELSRLASKLNTDRGRKWLYERIKKPGRRHARTLMPDLFLDPVVEKDPTGKPTGQVTDPAADIVAFLLSGSADWKPDNVPVGKLNLAEQRTLEELTLEWLGASFSKRKAKQYLREGIPVYLKNRIKEDERILIGLTEENRNERLLDYVGHRAITKYGCSGCHDIPGFENAKTIGTGLAGWGRKDSSQLSFEQISSFLATHGIDGNGNLHNDKNSTDKHDDEKYDAGKHTTVEASHTAHGLDPSNYDPDTGYYVQALGNHHRQGFIWQKLRMPRSYDYIKTHNIGYNERLRMPKFPINAEQREAIITFVLGLTSEPPIDQYVYKPSDRQRTIDEGKLVLRKYNCGGCHILQMEQWRFDYDPNAIEKPIETEGFPFLAAYSTETAIQQSLKIDRRGLRNAVLHGMPVINEETGEPDRVDDEGYILEEEDIEDDEVIPMHPFVLWRNALINGETYLRGQQVLVPSKRNQYGPINGEAHPTWGGTLTRYLFPRVISAEQEIIPQAKGSEAWGWLPPPLVGEGEKVQADWLHDFLIDPDAIRPAAVMRMPKFSLSSNEASKLANYFAAVDNAEFPYEYDTRRRASYLATREQSHAGHIEDALKIVVDKSYCVKCHYVGDFEPEGNKTALAPNLDKAYKRLRADYVRRWIADPQRLQPYTGMPVNIPYTNERPHFGGVDQELYPGTSTEQLDALVDLLMNFDVYSQRQTEISPLIKAATATTIEPPTEKSEEAAGQGGR